MLEYKEYIGKNSIFFEYVYNEHKITKYILHKKLYLRYYKGSLFGIMVKISENEK